MALSADNDDIIGTVRTGDQLMQLGDVVSLCILTAASLLKPFLATNLASVATQLLKPFADRIGSCYPLRNLPSLMRCYISIYAVELGSLVFNSVQTDFGVINEVHIWY